MRRLLQTIEAGESEEALAMLARVPEGEDVDGANRVRERAVDLAVGARSAAVVRRLAELGADLVSPNGQGRSPLMQAAICRCKEVVEALLAPGPGADAHAGSPAAMAGVLHVIATSTGWSDIAARLLELGADAWERGAHGRTALVLAAESGQTEFAAALLDGAAWSRRAVSAPGRAGRTALHEACEQGSLSMVQLLVRHGAETNTVWQCSRTPLEQAMRRGRPDLALAMLVPGANTDTGTMIGVDSTALHLAAERGYAEIAGRLLDLGADIDLATHFSDQTPLECAVARGSKRGAFAVAHLLLERGADAGSSRSWEVTFETAFPRNDAQRLVADAIAAGPGRRPRVLRWARRRRLVCWHRASGAAALSPWRLAEQP